MTAKPVKPMIVAGVMSGTSADGIDVAFTRIRETAAGVRIKLLGHHAVPYPKAVRLAVLRAMEPGPLTVPEMAQLNWRLGQLYANALEAASAKLGLKAALIGMHGQTIYHQAVASKFLGAQVRATWQTGEAAEVAERLRVPVVSDFRPADLAAGGQAAPLVPILDFTMYRHATKNRILLNLGGIANVTVIPAAAEMSSLLAFDTGPASMVIDAAMQRLFARKYDASGKTAAKGLVIEPVLAELLRDPYFAAAPPKSCGREQFGAAYVDRLLALCADARPEDVVATATALTARTIVDAYARFCWTHLGQNAPLARATELIVSGGGARNSFLIQQLKNALEPLKVKVIDIGATGIPAQAKEAVAFALLAWLTWHRRPGNVAAATGASRPVVLGKVTCV